MTKENFKVAAVRTVKSPSERNITTYIVWINFSDLPANISLDVNPRKPKMNTAVAKELIRAVVDPESTFDINNRGMVITAKSFNFNTTNSTATLDLGDNPAIYGILDGGHTYTAIIQNRDNVSTEVLKNKFVKAEIIVGEDVDVLALADARNTSIQVSDIALFELDDKFEIVKNAIQPEKYADDVAYKDNDDKRIPVVELLKLMFMLNIKRFPDDSTAPVQAYSAKASVFKDYRKEFDKKDNIYLKLAPLLPKLVTLYEKIVVDLPKKYNEFKSNEVKNPKFGGVKGIEVSDKSKNKRKYKLLFTDETTKYDISTGFILPIFGAFRALIKENGSGEIVWRFDPVELWNKIGVQLVQNTFDTGTNPQLVGKTKTLWQANYRIVDSAQKDLLLEQLQNKLNTQEN